MLYLFNILSKSIWDLLHFPSFFFVFIFFCGELFSVKKTAFPVHNISSWTSRQMSMHCLQRYFYWYEALQRKSFYADQNSETKRNARATKNKISKMLFSLETTRLRGIKCSKRNVTLWPLNIVLLLHN